MISPALRGVSGGKGQYEEKSPGVDRRGIFVATRFALAGGQHISKSMKPLFSLFVAFGAAALLANASPVHSADADIEDAQTALIVSAADVTLDEYAWVRRPLVVFADSPLDPRFVQQMDNIAADPDPLAQRDVVVIVDTDPKAKTAIRQTLRPRGFDLVLIGKDGQKYLRKPFPWDVREISRSIDKMPLRQQEMSEPRDSAVR